jgi:glycosyltransferase involved in cell wall biosynthesis
VSDRLRILFVAAKYLPSGGGTEMHTYEVARRMHARGHDVAVLTTDASRSLPTHEVLDGIPVERVPAWPRKRDYLWAPAVYRRLRERSTDIVHCQGYHTFVAPMAMLSASRAGLPYVVTLHSGGHSSSLRTRIRPLQWRALRPLLTRASRLVAVSRFEAELIGGGLGLPHDRFTVVPNGADMPVDDTADIVDGHPVRRDLVLSIGRLERYKGHQHVIAALPHVVRRRPDVRLRILGFGPYESELRALAGRLGVADRVEIGGIPGGDRVAVARMLAEAALVVSLSDYEAHSIAALEAAYLGRPMLVRESTGLAELVERRLAVGVPVGADDETVAAAIVQQLESPMPPGSFELATWDDCTARLLELYRSVLTHRRQRTPWSASSSTTSTTPSS